MTHAWLMSGSKSAARYSGARVIAMWTEKNDQCMWGKLSTALTKEPESFSRGTILRNVCSRLMEEATMWRAFAVEPSSRRTPDALPFSNRISSTPCLRNTRPPAWANDSQMEWARAWEPPRQTCQLSILPTSSGKETASPLRSVEEPARAAGEARWAFTLSFSKCSFRKSFMLIRRRWTLRNLDLSWTPQTTSAFVMSFREIGGEYIRVSRNKSRKPLGSSLCALNESPPLFV